MGGTRKFRKCPHITLSHSVQFELLKRSEKKKESNFFCEHLKHFVNTVLAFSELVISVCEKNKYLLNLEKHVFFYFKIELKVFDRKFKKLMQY